MPLEYYGLTKEDIRKEIVDRIENNELKNCVREKTFAEQVDAALNGTLDRYSALKVCNTPQILLDVGCKLLPMFYTQTHLRVAIKPKNLSLHHHGLTVTQIKGFPEKMLNPVFVIDSITQPNSILMVLNDYDVDKCPIIAAVKPNGVSSYNLEVLDSNFVASFFGRENFINFIKDSIRLNKILFYDKKKSEGMFSVLGQQFPKGLNGLASNTIIHKSAAFVNSSDENNDKKRSEGLFSVLGRKCSSGLNNLASDIIIHQSRNIVNTSDENNDKKNKELTFSEQVDAVFSGTFDPNIDLYVCETPEVFLKIGLPDKPLLMRNSKVEEIFDKHSEMTVELLKQLPELLQKPIMILKSKTNPDNSVVAITEIITNKGEMIVPIWVNQEGVYIDFVPDKIITTKTNFVASVYGRNIKTLIDYAIKNDGILYVSEDTEKVSELVTRHGLQLPAPLKVSNLTIITPKENKNVNSSVKEKTQSSANLRGLQLPTRFIGTSSSNNIIPEENTNVNTSDENNPEKISPNFKLIFNTAAQKVVNNELSYVNETDYFSNYLVNEAKALKTSGEELKINDTTIQQSKYLLEHYTDLISKLPLKNYGLTKEDIRETIINNIENSQIKNILNSKEKYMKKYQIECQNVNGDLIKWNEPHMAIADDYFEAENPAEAFGLALAWMEDQINDYGFDVEFNKEGNIIYAKDPDSGEISGINYGFIARDINDSLNRIYSLDADGIISNENGEIADSDGLQFILSDDESFYSVTDIGNYKGTDIVIPAEYKGKPVTVIENGAFSEYKYITSVTIPDSIKSIGSFAFDNCTGLKEITIPASVETIFSYAFDGCENLKEVHFKGNNLETIGVEAFNGCPIEHIDLPDSVTTIDEGAFRNTNIQEVEIPKGCEIAVDMPINNIVGSFNPYTKTIRKIPANQSNYSEGLIIEPTYSDNFCVVKGIGTCKEKDINIPAEYNGIPVIGINEAAFYDCKNITSVTLPDSIKDIDVNAFAGCTGLTKIVIPDSVIEIHSGAFEDCTNLTDVTLGKNVEYIGYCAFWKCPIEHIEIPDSVKIIDSAAFEGTKLKQVELPEKCEIIENSTNPDYENSFNSDTQIIRKIPANQSNYSEGLIIGINEDKKTCFVVGRGTCKDKDIKIPAEYNGLPVTVIDDGAFYGCDIHSIEIPDSITTIGIQAFADCRELKSVTIGKGIELIEDFAFEGCTNLESITIPNSLNQFSAEMFLYCDNLKEIKTVKEMYQLKDLVPYDCKMVYLDEAAESSNLEFGLNNSKTAYFVSNIGSCKDTNIIIPKEYNGLPVTAIANGAFANTNIESVDIPDSIKSIENAAFYDCKKLKSVIIPDSVTEIWTDAFNGCTSLDSVLIGENVTKIGKNAFAYTNLESVVIPDSVKKIDYNAFKNVNLKEISVPTKYLLSVTDLPIKCKVIDRQEVEKLMYSQGLEYTLAKDNNSYIVSGIGTCTDTDLRIPPKYNGLPVTKIDEDAFRDSVSIENVTISDSVTKIDNGAFEDCYSLKNVYLGSGIVSIDDWAFAGCNNLKSINIPKNVDYIGYGAFCACENLKNITLDPENETYKSIDGSIYSEDKTQLFIYSKANEATEFTVPETVTDISHYAFDCCYNLQQIKLPDSLITIGDGAFKDCRNLIKIDIPDNVTFIGSGVFDGCDSLEEISTANAELIDEDDIPDWCDLTERYNPTYSEGLYYELSKDGRSYSVAGMGDCKDTYLNIPPEYSGKPVTMIASNAFNEEESLESVSIPDSVKWIQEGAFRDCANLESVIIPDSVIGIEEQAFSGCGFKEIYIPESVKNIGDEAFSYCNSLQKITVNAANTNFKSIDGNLYSKDNKELIQYAIGKEKSSFTIPNFVKYVANSAFAECDNLVNISIPEGVEEIGYTSFFSCRNLEKVVIPNSVTDICADAFSGCYNLKEVTLGSGIDNIESGTFLLCNLENILIPDNVKSVEASAFSGCEKLKEISVANAEILEDVQLPESCNVIDRSVSTLYSEGLDYMQSVDKTYYLVKGIGTCNDVDIKIPPKHNGKPVKAINDIAFYGENNIKTVTLSENTMVIGREAFSGCTNLEKVVMPEGVTHISELAFEGCYKLKEVDIPSTVNSINWGAFSYCTSLESITVDKDNRFYKSTDGVLYDKDGETLLQYAPAQERKSFAVPDGVKTIKSEAFKNSNDLESITIPDTVTVVGEDAFAGCTNLENITLSKNLEEIGDYTFYDCRSLKDITIPESVTYIGTEAFSNCTSLTEITLPDSVTEIGGTAFNRCYNLKNVSLGDGIKIIREAPFAECDSLRKVSVADENILKDVTLPSSCIVTERKNDLKYQKFEGNDYYTVVGIGEYKGKNIVIPDTYKGLPVGAINDFAFNGLTEIESIYIGKNVEDCGYLALDECNNLKSITVDKDNKTYKSADGVLYDKKGELLIQYPVGNRATTLTVPDGVEEIGERALYGASHLKNITLPDSLTVISPYAFQCCGDLESIEIPDKVYSIGMGAFDGCISLKNVSIGNGVQNINADAFYCCESLKEITIPDKVTSINNSAFAECSSLEKVTIYNGAINVAHDIFYGCKNLKEIRVPYATNKLDFVELPDSCKVIDEIVDKTVAPACSKGLKYELNADGLSYTVAGIGKCKDKDIKIPAEYDGKPVCVIGEKAFENSKITSVVIPDSVRTISEKAFGFSKIQQINMGNGVTSIGVDAFYKCQNLTKVSLPDSVKEVGDNAFYYCSKLATITAPEHLKLESGDTSIPYWTKVNKSPKKENKASESVKNPNYQQVDMADRGIDKLNFGDREVLEKAFKLKNGEEAKKLFNGETISGNEAYDEQLLMTKIALHTNDPEQAMRIFKASGQYRDNKPNAYYENVYKHSTATISSVRNANTNTIRIATVRRSSSSNTK